MLICGAALVLHLGCVRGGFGPSETRRNYDGLPEQGRGDTTRLFGPLTKAHDTCTTALLVDLGSLPQQRLAIQADPSGARNDLGLPCCAGNADLLLKAVNIVGAVAFGCTGPGRMTVAFSTALDCPGQGGCVQIKACDGASEAIWAFSGSQASVVICRNPADGPFTLQIRDGARP